MLKFQCRLLAHWVNLLEELVVFESRKYIRRMEMKVLGSDDAMILILSLFGQECRFYFRLALLESISPSYSGLVGGVAEGLNEPVLKTDVGESLPWVRIPPPPP